MATKSIGLLAALAPAMAIRQLMSDVRPDEEAALRALVPPVEPIQKQPLLVEIDAPAGHLQCSPPQLTAWPWLRLNQGRPALVWSANQGRPAFVYLTGLRSKWHFYTHNRAEICLTSRRKALRDA